MVDHMFDFHHLMKNLSNPAINFMGQEFAGFYRYAKIIETIASGIATGRNGRLPKNIASPQQSISECASLKQRTSVVPHCCSLWRDIPRICIGSGTPHPMHCSSRCATSIRVCNVTETSSSRHGSPEKAGRHPHHRHCPTPSSLQYCDCSRTARRLSANSRRYAMRVRNVISGCRRNYLRRRIGNGEHCSRSYLSSCGQPTFLKSRVR